MKLHDLSCRIEPVGTACQYMYLSNHTRKMAERIPAQVSNTPWDATRLHGWSRPTFPETFLQRTRRSSYSPLHLLDPGWLVMTSMVGTGWGSGMILEQEAEVNETDLLRHLPRDIWARSIRHSVPHLTFTGHRGFPPLSKGSAGRHFRYI